MKLHQSFLIDLIGMDVLKIIGFIIHILITMSLQQTTDDKHLPFSSWQLSPFLYSKCQMTECQLQYCMPAHTQHPTANDPC